MLPNSTNRYGDMLREFYDGMKNGNLSEVRLNEIVRVFNELSQREDQYKGWMQTGTGKIEPSKIDQYPFPLETIHAYTDTVTNSIPNNTETAVTFDLYYPSTGYSVTRKMYFNGNKIYFVVPPLPQSLIIGVFAIGNWASNATGRRALSMKAYNSSGVEVGGGTTLYSFKASGLAGVPDVYPGISWILPSETVAYYQLSAYQNSGGALDLEYAEIAFFFMQTVTR